MRIRPFLTTFSAFWLLLALFMAGCGPQPTNQNTNANRNAAMANNSSVAIDPTSDAAKSMAATCTAEDDRQIEKQIWILIESDPSLKTQTSHINVYSKYCTVRLDGWVATFDDFKKLYDFVYNAPGVRKISITTFRVGRQPEQTECPAPNHVCGELCLPEDVVCTQPGGGGTGGIKKSPTPTPTP
jgi:hypothetical protein